MREGEKGEKGGGRRGGEERRGKERRGEERRGEEGEGSCGFVDISRGEEAEERGETFSRND